MTDVHLKLEEQPDPVTAVTTNVSLGGMSVAIQRPAEIGSLAAFELEVGGALVEGTGEVAWVRGATEGPDQMAGMGLRFRYLSPGSRERIFRLVQWYANQGGAASGEAVAAASNVLSPPPGGVKNPAPKRDNLESTHSLAPTPPNQASPPPDRVWSEEPEPLVPDDLLSDLPAREELPIEPVSRSSAPPLQPAGEPFHLEDSADEKAGFDGLEWVSAAEIRQSEPEPPLVLPPAPEEPTLTPAQAAQETPLARPRLASPSPSRGAGYAKAGKPSIWRWLVVVLFAGLIAFAVWQWWPVFSRIQGSSNEPAAPTTPASSPTTEVSVPSREDATRETAPSPSPPPAVEPLEPAAAPPSQAAAQPTATAESEPAAVTPVPTEPAAPALAERAREVRRIAWESAEGSTTLVIEADGALKSASVSASLLSGSNPRVLLKIKGIERKYTQDRIQVGTREVATIRVGLHASASGSELHVVLDLKSQDLQLTSSRIDGNVLRLSVRTAR